MLTSPYPVPASRAWSATSTLAYACVAAAGAWVLISPPASYSGLSTALTIAWGALCLVPGILTAFGTLSRRYRWEWLSLWWAAMGVGMYAVLSWGQVFGDGPGHGPRALLVTALALLLIRRAIQLALIDRSARHIADLEETHG